MPRYMTAQRALGLLLAIFVLQACTCFGVPLESYSSRLAASGSEPPAGGSALLPPPPRLDCDQLRLTSPLEGLPNGVATFYWNSLAGVLGYRINLYADSGAFLAGFDAPGDATNLSADVSQSAIGGQFIIQVEFIGVGSQGNECRRMLTLLREAPNLSDPAQPPQPPAQPGMTPTPTCDENPYADYC